MIQRLGSDLVIHDGVTLSQFLGEKYGRYKAQKEWATGVQLKDKRDLVRWTDGFWWSWRGVGTKTIAAGEVPFANGAVQSNWYCHGSLSGFPENDSRNYNVFPDEGDVTNALKYLFQLKDGVRGCVVFSAGVYDYTDLGSLKLRRSTWMGVPNMGTILRCNNTTVSHIAFKVDAWPDPADPNQPFIDGLTIQGFHIEGNANTSVVLEMQGVSRSHFADVTVWGTNMVGIGVNFKASSLNQFDRLMCSKYRNLAGQTVNKPQYGIVVDTGTRAGVGQGGPSNNLFLNMYMEGVLRGMLMKFGDQNTFIGGSCEANSDYGAVVQAGCRYNTFMGMGNENLNATTADWLIQGHYTKMLNTYGSQRVVVGAGSRGTLIDGGYFELIEVQTNAVDTTIKDCTVNHWNSGNGGFVDNGINTDARDVYDADLKDFINTTDVRKPVTFTVTPVSGGTRGDWVNPTRAPVTVYIQGTASITAASISRDGDAVSLPLTSLQTIMLYAKDTLSLTWSSSGSAPSVSYRRFRWN